MDIIVNRFTCTLGKEVKGANDGSYMTLRPRFFEVLTSRNAYTGMSRSNRHLRERSQVYSNTDNGVKVIIRSELRSGDRIESIKCSRN